MLFRLKRQLKRLKTESAPSKAFKSQLWSRLELEMGQEQVCVPRRRLRFVTSSVLASLIVVFGMGTGVYAYESPAVVDGHPLHFLKDSIESVEGRFAISSEERSRYHARMMDRRLAESEYHMGKTDKAERALEYAAERLEMSVEELLEGLEEGEVREEVLEILAEQRERYEQLRSRVVESEGDFDEAKPLRERSQKWGLSEKDHQQLFRDGRRPGGEELPPKSFE